MHAGRHGKHNNGKHSSRDGHVKIIFRAPNRFNSIISRWDCQDLAAGLVYGGRDLLTEEGAQSWIVIMD
jgi:hypothetical protein